MGGGARGGFEVNAPACVHAWRTCVYLCACSLSRLLSSVSSILRLGSVHWNPGCWIWTWHARRSATEARPLWVYTPGAAAPTMASGVWRAPCRTPCFHVRTE